MAQKIYSGKNWNILFSLAVICVIVFIYDYKFNDSSIKYSISNYLPKSNSSDLVESPLIGDDIAESSESTSRNKFEPISQISCASDNAESINFIKNRFFQRALDALDHRCENYTEIYNLIRKVKKENDADAEQLEQFVSAQEATKAREIITKIRNRSQDYDISQLESKLIEMEKIAIDYQTARIIYPLSILCNGQKDQEAACPWNYFENGTPVRAQAQPGDRETYIDCFSSDIKYDRLKSQIILSNHCTERFITDQSDETKIYYKKISCGGFLAKKCQWNYSKNGSPLFIKAINGKSCTESSYEFQTSNNRIVMLDKCQAEFETNINL